MNKMTKQELRDLLDEHEERYQALYEENDKLRATVTYLQEAAASSVSENYARDIAGKADIDRLNKLLYLVGKLTFENDDLRNRLNELEKEKQI